VTVQPVTELSIADAIRSLHKENDDTAVPMEWIAEVMAFNFAENCQENEIGWGTYFGPKMVFNNQDGPMTEFPSIKKVTREIIAYWERRAKETQRPVLKARYANLVWDFSRPITRQGAAIENARIAIDSLIVKVFDKDAALYFRVLLTDQRGWNIRNNVCHGIIPFSAFNRAMSDRLIHALLCLALVRKGENEVTT
jgi:hypothetical protein